MPNQAGKYEFGSFRLEPGERRLTQGGQPVAVTPKAFDLLVILVEHAGSLMKKEDLLERLWPGVFVEEVNLAQNVSALRKALGGDRESYIQTVAGAGYRFVCPVKTAPSTSDSPAPATRRRLIVLPFRMLKPDAELDFLSFSLPDAITSELSALDSLIVRSSLIAARYAGDSPDLARIAREAQVEFAVSGTLLRAGNQLRVSAQLADAVAGTVIWSHTAQSPVDDLFQLQDSLAGRIAGSLVPQLTASDSRRFSQDVPATARAYELFLRANQASPSSAFSIERVTVARDLYLASIGEDAGYAPAWARLARMYRLLGKYVPADADANLAQADEALERALALNPDLSIAHNLSAQIDVDRGRAEDAMLRLLGRLRVRGPHPELYAGLVQACRFCGLLDASLAAHTLAQRLDPALPTSVMHTYFVTRRYQDVLDVSGDVKGYVYSLSLHGLGRDEEALANVASYEGGGPLMPMLIAVRQLITGDREASGASMIKASLTFGDPEAFFYAARHLAFVKHSAAALDALEKSVAGGYLGIAAVDDDPWLAAIRTEPKFQDLLTRARARHANAVAVFREAGGPGLLGV